MRPLTRTALMGAAVFAAGVGLYLPTIRYDYVQDDRAIIQLNPAAHSIGAALRAFDAPYWPLPSLAGLYRPVTTLSFAVDWTASHGSAGWMHFENALWHGLASVLLVLVLARWLPFSAAAAAGFVFAVHPVHVEGVANLVSRNELLATAGMFAAVLAARRRRWGVSLVCLSLAMLSKERGVVGGVMILLDDWLRPRETAPYPRGFYAWIAAMSAGYVAAWWHIGRSATANVAAPFIGAGTGARLAMALPALGRATHLLFWPDQLSADYSPQVIAFRTGVSFAALLGAGVACGIVTLVWVARRRAPALSFGAGAAALAALPTSNLLFASGIVLSERDLYLPVVLPAVLFAAGVFWAHGRWPSGRLLLLAAVAAVLLAARAFVRLPAWTDNRMFLLTLVTEHPESYRGQQTAGAVLAGMGDTAAAHAAYARAESLFAGDPHFNAGYAFFLVLHGDTAGAARLAQLSRRAFPREAIALRVEFLLARGRGAAAQARAVADTAVRWFPSEASWYTERLETRP